MFSPYFSAVYIVISYELYSFLGYTSIYFICSVFLCLSILLDALRIQFLRQRFISCLQGVSLTREYISSFQGASNIRKYLTHVSQYREINHIRNMFQILAQRIVCRCLKYTGKYIMLNYKENISCSQGVSSTIFYVMFETRCISVHHSKLLQCTVHIGFLIKWFRPVCRLS